MNRRLLFFLLGASLVYGMISLFREEEPPATGNVAALSVTVISPEHGRISDVISVTGITIPREEIQLMTELSGMRVREVMADAGDNVKKGQILAVLDGESLVHQLAQLRSDYERAADAFSRTNALKDSGAVSKQSVIETRTAMQAAKALLDDAELNLKRSTIIAPEAGMVFERKAVIGGLVTNSEPLFRIARHNEIELEAKVPESTLSGLTAGQPVSVMLAGEPTPTPGAIRLITPRVYNTTRMATLRIGLQHKNPLPVGLFATARILQSGREGLLLPKTALQQDSAGHFVWILNAENIAERYPVNVTVSGDEQVMVEAAPADANVVARAGAFIKAGDRVHVVEGN